VNLDPQQVTVLGLVLAIGMAGLKKVWVWGWTYAEKVAELVEQLAETKKDRDFWRDIALRSMGHTDRALDVAGIPRTGSDG
jgi:hypothetical protein